MVYKKYGNRRNEMPSEWRSPTLFVSNEEEQGSLDGLVLGAKKVADRWWRFFSMILWCSVD
jgi:hypothetical protein